MLIGRYGEYVPAGVPLRCRSGACDHLHLHSFFTLFAPSTNPALGPANRPARTRLHAECPTDMKYHLVCVGVSRGRGHHISASGVPASSNVAACTTWAERPSHPSPKDPGRAPPSVPRAHRPTHTRLRHPPARATIHLLAVAERARPVPVDSPRPQLAGVRHGVIAPSGDSDATHPHTPKLLDWSRQHLARGARVAHCGHPRVLSPCVHESIFRERERMAPTGRDAVHTHAPQRLDTLGCGLVVHVAPQRLDTLGCGLVVHIAVAQNAATVAPPREELALLTDGEGFQAIGAHAAHTHSPEPVDRHRP
eukprot:scaffold24196_cov120-Isochrysis_galbana.AAC.4